MKICIFLALGTVNFFDLQQGKEISSLISKKHVIVSFSRNKMKSTLLALQSLLAHCKLNSFSFVYYLWLYYMPPSSTILSPLETGFFWSLRMKFIYSPINHYTNRLIFMLECKGVGRKFSPCVNLEW